MLKAEERYQLLEEVSELSARWDYAGVAECLSQAAPEWLLVEPELGHSLARALYYAGRQRESAEWARKLSEPCRRHSSWLFGRHLLLRGSLCVEKGDLDEGCSLFERCAVLAERNGDQVQLADATLNMGVVHVIRCEWETGLAAFRRATAAYTRSGRTVEVADCAHNSGMAYREMGRLSFASEALDFAAQRYRAMSNLARLCTAESERALVFQALGEIELSHATIQRALRLALQCNNLRLEGEVLRVRGLISRSQGRLAEARAHLNRALMLAQQTNTAMLQAEVTEELGTVYNLQGDHTAAVRFTTLAMEMYSKLGAQTRADLMARRLNGL